MSLTLIDKLNTINKPPITSYSRDTAKTIEEFWDKFVTPHLPKTPQEIKVYTEWFELLLKYCNDPDIVLHAVRRDHTQLQYASESLRANRTVVSAVVCQPHKNKTVPAAVKWISDELKDDTELMLQAVKANPQAYTYISPRLKQDPAILALPHEEKAMDSDDIATKIQKMIDEL